MWSQAETLGKMNELVSLWYIVMPPAKHNLNKTWTLLFPILCTTTRESSKDICASFDKESMAVQLIFQKPTGPSSCLCWKLSSRLKVMKQTKKRKQGEEGKMQPSSREREWMSCNIQEVQWWASARMDEGTGGFLNSSGLGWFPRKARCHSPY